MNSSLQPWSILSATINVGTLTEGWTLAKLPDHSGASRSFLFEVPFAFPFTAAPVVQLGLTGFDIDQRHTARLCVRAIGITTEGFRAEIITWDDTRVYAVECNWLAIGA